MSASTSETNHTSRVSTRLVAAGTAIAALSIALLYTFYFVFSRSMSLDEGYLMITVQGFNSGHALYDGVFTQYGPFYYFYEWLLHSVLAIPLTHDATRFLCIVHWLVAAGILGVAAWRMTRSALAGFFVATLSVVHLSTIANEPGHPQELIVVLLALGAWVASGFSRNRWTLAALAVIGALLAFTKINVGAFFVFALLLAACCHSPDRFTRGPWKWLLLGLSAVLPFALMRQHLAADWCRHFALLAASATVATLFTAQRGGNADAPAIARRNYLTAAAAFGALSALLIGVTLFTGTSWKGLIDGLILTPMKMPRLALLRIDIPTVAVLGALASLGMAILVRSKPNDERIIRALPVLKSIYAVVGAFLLFGNAKGQLAFLLPWVWLVAVPGAKNSNPGEQFARSLLCLAAAWQSLQVYPIAGTQVTLAAFLPVLSYGVCLADGLRALAGVSRVHKMLAAMTPASRPLAQALAAAAVLFLFANAWCKLPQVRREHASLLPLNLPGSRFVRMNEEVTTMNQQLARYLDTECDTFVSYPGINSLYFWTGKTPPTQINSTGWGQLTHAQQEQILGSLRHARRPKLVVTEAMMQSWATPYADPIRPLVRYVTEECRPVKRIGRCLIFEPKNSQEMTARR
jgi:hypothetical protein